LYAKAMTVNPGSGYIADFYADFLGTIGLDAEAAEIGRHGFSMEPYFRYGRTSYAMELARVGQAQAATDVLAQARREWPDSAAIRSTLFEVALLEPDGSRALAMLDDPDIRPLLGGGATAAEAHAESASLRANAAPGGAIEAWRTILQAERSSDQTRRLAASKFAAAAAQSGQIPPEAAIQLMANLGDIDDAFAQTDRLFTPQALAKPQAIAPDTSFLFSPLTQPMRRDPRFIALMGRLGVLDYWRTSGHWPDFCAEPGLPYDCKMEAAKRRRSATV
jgi:hypothetical protein